MKKLIRSWDDVPVVVDAFYAAMLLGLSARAVRYKCHSGKIRAVREGKSWIITKKALMDYCGDIGPWAE